MNGNVNTVLFSGKKFAPSSTGVVRRGLSLQEFTGTENQLFEGMSRALLAPSFMKNRENNIEYFVNKFSLLFLSPGNEDAISYFEKVDKSDFTPLLAGEGRVRSCKGFAEGISLETITKYITRIERLQSNKTQCCKKIANNKIIISKSLITNSLYLRARITDIQLTKSITIN
ncbi:MAG: hypothetical protein ACHQQQ_09960 [Bacteroidota bacterium]